MLGNQISSPTTFEVPAPAASQSAYSNPEAYKQQNTADNEQKSQQVLPKSVELPRPPLALYRVNQPFDSHPQPLSSGLSQQQNLPDEAFQLQEVPRKHTPLLFPVYDQRGPFRHPGQFVPSQYVHQNGIFQIFPVGNNFGKVYQDGNNQDYSIKNNYEQIKGERNLQIDFPVQKQEYHAHPNGAISFARFTHNLPDKSQHVPQPRPEPFHQPQRAQYQSQGIPVQLPAQVQPEVMLQSQQQQAPSLNQKLPYPSVLQGIIQDLQNYQSVYKQQNQFSHIEQPRTVNTVQQHLLHQQPQQSSNLQIIQLQSVPPFNPQSLQEIAERKPRPFGYTDQSQTQLKNNDLSLEQASVQLTALPPLKPNYSKYVKPLEPRTTSPIFLPTTLQQLSTSTAKLEPVPDQLISSTTVQPDVKDQEGTKQEETETQSPTPQPEPEIIHQSQPTVSPSSGQPTTYRPFITNEPQSLIFQTTPQPSYQSTIRPTSQKHDVVIQRQEIQEIFLEPPFQPPSAPYDRNGQKLHLPYSVPELHHLRAQPHYQFFEQLLPYRHEMQDVHSPQEFIVEARQSHQNPNFAQQGKSRQYLIHQNSIPLQFQQFQPAQLQNLGLEQGQQPESNQAQQHQRALEQAQQRQQKAFELLQQHQESDQQQLQEAQHQQQTQQRQEELEQLQHKQQVEQQQEALEQAQHRQQSELQKEALNQAQHQQQVEQQQEALEQAQHQQQAEQQQTLEQQKQDLEQPQQLSQESEQVLKQQLQQNSLESTNQILISTLTPLENTEKQTETVEIQQQTEVEQDLKFQSTTGKPDEQPEHLPGPTSNLEQPYVGPYLTSSLNPQIYANHQLVHQPEQSPLLNVPAYTDVQYFGKFAQALFGGQH